MPLVAMASAIARTICSSTLPWNLFQLFQPIGGVSARWFMSWPNAGTQRIHAKMKKYFFIENISFLLWPWSGGIGVKQASDAKPADQFVAGHWDGRLHKNLSRQIRSHMDKTI